MASLLPDSKLYEKLDIAEFYRLLSSTIDTDTSWRRGPERNWKDEDVYDYFAYSFTCLPMEKALGLCKKWWNFYNGISTEYPGYVSVCVALHLVHPTGTRSYLIDMAPETTTLPENKELMKVLSSTSLEEANEDPIKCNESNASDHGNILKFNRWYNSLSQVSKITFTAFLAGSVFRVFIKNKEAVKRYISNSLMTDFVKLYGRQANGLTVPLPSSKYLDNLSHDKSELDRMVFSRYLAVYKNVHSDPSCRTVRSLLERVLLNETSGNGLKLVSLALDAAEVLKVDADEMLDDIQGLTDIKRHQDVRMFMSRRMESVLWPWCRIFSNKYHNKLQLKDNILLATVFAFLLGPRGDEPIWNLKYFDYQLKANIKARALNISTALRRKYRVGI